MYCVHPVQLGLFGLGVRGPIYWNRILANFCPISACNYWLVGYSRPTFSQKVDGGGMGLAVGLKDS